jgi:hypothetical protein
MKLRVMDLANKPQRLDPIERVSVQRFLEDMWYYVVLCGET